MAIQKQMGQIKRIRGFDSDVALNLLDARLRKSHGLRVLSGNSKKVGSSFVINYKATNGINGVAIVKSNGVVSLGG